MSARPFHPLARPRLFSALFVLVLGLPLAAAVRPSQNPFASRPEPEHALLKKLAGRWTTRFKLTMPGAPEIESEGTEENELLGELWLVGRYHDAQMQGGGFEGAQTLGYDPDRKKYVAVWADNQDSHLGLQEGSYDAATRTLALGGPTTNPMTGEASHMRSTMEWIDDDHRVSSMFVPGPGGKEMQMFTIEYARVK